MASFLDRRGYRGENKGVRNLLYCAPEEFVEVDHPYAFDIYSVAACWLRIMIPGLRSSEDDFFNFRTDVRDCRHDLQAWHDAIIDQEVDTTIKVPYGWEEFFHSSSEGEDAFDLLNRMMQYRPENRPSASEALLQPYLNPACMEPKRPIPPARPWSLTSHIEKFFEEQSLSDKDNCEIPEWFLDEMIDGDLKSKLDSLHY